MSDDVALTDLEVIQRYSLAVRGATADRAELTAALRADLAWLEKGGRSRPATGPVVTDEEPRRPVSSEDAASPATGTGAPAAAGRSKPAPGRPAPGKPAASKPATAKPSAAKPAASKPAAAKPAAKPAARAASTGAGKASPAPKGRARKA